MTISFDQFKELDLRIGTVIAVEDHPDADNLLLLKVDIGEADHRQLVAGIKGHYEPDQLEGRQIAVVANLESATIRGEESKGMLLAADADQSIVLLGPDQNVEPGTRIR